MKLWISPHNDDAVLFGAYTLMREKPLVLTVTDSFIQQNRGENILAQERWEEDVKAMEFLRCSIVRGGIRDDILDETFLIKLLVKFRGFDTVYLPALQGGNKDHDLISIVGDKVFNDGRTTIRHYCTYTKDKPHTIGASAVEPTNREADIKKRAMEFYKSQINLPSTKMYFEAQKGMSEWFI